MDDLGPFFYGLSCLPVSSSSKVGTVSGSESFQRSWPHLPASLDGSRPHRPPSMALGLVCLPRWLPASSASLDGSRPRLPASFSGSQPCLPASLNGSRPRLPPLMAPDLAGPYSRWWTPVLDRLQTPSLPRTPPRIQLGLCYGDLPSVVASSCSALRSRGLPPSRLHLAMSDSADRTPDHSFPASVPVGLLHPRLDLL